MNTVDLAVLVVVLSFAVLGAISGFAWQFFRLAAWGLALALAFGYAEPLGASIPDSWGNLDGSARTIIAWAVIFVGIRVVMVLVAKMAKNALDKARLGTADRSLGFLLGGLKGAFLVALVLQLVLFFGSRLSSDLEAQLYGDPDRGIEPSQAVKLHGKIVAPWVVSAMPEDEQKELWEKLERRFGGR